MITKKKSVKKKKLAIEDKPEKVPYTGYDLARAGLRATYITLPAAAYVATSGKLDEIQDMFFLKRWIASIFYNGQIERLNEAHSVATYATGAAAALAAGYAVNTIVEKTLPSNKQIRDILRKPAQMAGYFTVANIANATLKGDKISIPLVKSTMDKGLEVLTNFNEATSGSDIEKATNMGIATLLGITAIKATDYMARSKPAKVLYNTIKSAYNSNPLTGKAAEEYDERTSRRVLANRKNDLTSYIRQSKKEESIKRR
jgi:hypothetical protein